MTKYSAFGTALQAGVSQIETATIVGTITGDGDAEVVITCTGMTGTPITETVAVLENDTPDMVAEKIRAALDDNANITALFAVEGVGAEVRLRKLIATANIADLNIAYDNDTCTGLTPDAESTATQAGVALAELAQVKSFGGPGISADTEDVTTHDSTGGWEEVVITILRSGEISMEVEYDPGDNTLVSYCENKTRLNFDIEFPGSVNWQFDGYVTSFEPSAPVDGTLTANVTVKIDSAPTLA